MNITLKDIFNRNIQYAKNSIIESRECGNKDEEYFFLGAEKAWIDAYNDLDMEEEDFKKKYLLKHIIIVLNYYYITKHYYYIESIIDGYNQALGRIFKIIDPNVIDEISQLELNGIEENCMKQAKASGYVNDNGTYIPFTKEQQEEHNKMFSDFLNTTYLELISKIDKNDMKIKTKDILKDYKK